MKQIQRWTMTVGVALGSALILTTNVQALGSGPSIDRVYDWLRQSPPSPMPWATTTDGAIVLDDGSLLEPGECITKTMEKSPLSPPLTVLPEPEQVCFQTPSPVPLKGLWPWLGAGVMGLGLVVLGRRARPLVTGGMLLLVTGEAPALRRQDFTTRCDYRATEWLETDREKGWWVSPQHWQSTQYPNGHDFPLTMYSVINYALPATNWAFTFDFAAPGNTNTSWRSTKLPRGSAGIAYMTKKAGSNRVHKCNILFDPGQILEIGEIQNVNPDLVMQSVLLHEWGHCLALDHFDDRATGEPQEPRVDSRTRFSVMNYATYYEMTDVNAHNFWIRFSSAEIEMIEGDLAACP